MNGRGARERIVVVKSGDGRFLCPLPPISFASVSSWVSTTRTPGTCRQVVAERIEAAYPHAEPESGIR